jgi:hypothetical protein
VIDLKASLNHLPFSVIVQWSALDVRPEAIKQREAIIINPLLSSFESLVKEEG